MALFTGEIPAIILPKFIETRDCNEIVSNLRNMGMSTYTHVSHAVGRLGLAQMEYHLKGTKKDYFDRVDSAKSSYQRAIARTIDPIEKLLGYLRHCGSTHVDIAMERALGSYFAGTFRNVTTLGHLHFDFAPFEAKGWDISIIEQQLSWNLYLNQPSGGNLRVFRRFYNTEDEVLRVAGEYYYNKSIVEDSVQFVYSPRIGDIVIFNSRYFHEVEPVTGDRYSLSSFIGKEKDGKLILWS